MSEPVIHHPEIMRVPDACRYLKVTRKTLGNWMRGRNLPEGAPPLPYSSIGRTVRFRRQRIDEWLDALAGFNTTVRSESSVALRLLEETKSECGPSACRGAS